MKHKLLIFIALFLSLKVYSQIDENYLEKESIMAKEDSSQLIRQNDSDKWLAEYIKETHAKLLQGNIEKDYRASVCDNLDFEEGNFTGWICQTGVNNGYPAGSWTGSLPVANRHTIETGGTDPYGGFPKVAPGGGTYSVRLGNDGVGRQAERIIFSFIVGPTDTNFIYKYAVVFEDPNHPVDEQPYFQLQILNSQNQVITCGQQHYTAASNIPGFIYAGNDVWYKPWTTVGIKLAAYVGQPVTVIVTNADCSRSGHFGYSYVDFICPQNMVAQTVNFCENDNSAILQVPNISPGATYLWSTGETTPTITINPQNFNDSTIQCYVTPPDVPTGCGFWYTFPINVNPLPIINVTSNPSTICYGESSLLSVNGANTYAWSHSLGSGITKTVTPTTSTTYSVTGTDINNCSNTATITVTVNPIPDISITADQTLCHNTQTTPINFTSSVTNTVFNWTNDNTTIGLAASGSGNIPFFTATNTGPSPQTATIIATPSFTNNGVTCTGSSDTFLITVNPIPDISITADQTLCHNTQTTPINFTSSVTNTVFNWTNDNTTIGLADSGNGDIPSFTVTNTGSSPQTATIIATPSFTNNGVTCTGSSDTFLITVNPIPDISATADQTLCHNTQTTPINFTSSVTNTVFNWTNDNTTIGLAASGSGNIPSFTATNTGPSPQTATIIATPSFTNNGVTCTGSSDTFLITVNPIPDISITADQTLCHNTQTTPINFTSSVTNTVFNWTNDNTTIGLAASGSGNISSFTATNTGPSPQTATIIATPSFTNNGVTCTGSSDTFLITVNPIPDISATADQTLCHNTQTTAINFTSSVTNTVFNWTNDNTTIGLAASGSGNISSFTATNTGSSPQTATIIATPFFTNNGVTCTGSSDTFLITVNPIPDIASVSDQSLCANLLTTPINFVSTVNNTLFSWINDNPSIGLPSSGSGNIPSFTVINESLELQTATIIVTPSFTNNGVTCTGVSETFLINVYPLTIAGFSVLPNHTSEDDGLVNIIDYSIGATSWYYDFGVEDDVNDIFTEREPIYRYNYEGNYTIMQIVNNQYNCPDTAYNDVIVKPSIIFYIPNAFTPNEDDKNEFFMPYGFNVSPLEYEFRIYDRWGKQLFYTTDINQGWDGKYKGEYVKQDMYVYMVKVRLEDGPQVFRGSVYLLK